MKLTLPTKRSDRVLTPRPLDSFPVFDSLDALIASDRDGIWYPEDPGRRPLPGWLDPVGRPYVLQLHDAELYPRFELKKMPAHDRALLPAGMASGDLHLILTGDGGLVPDSFAKSRTIPTSVRPADSGEDWLGHGLPRPRVTLPGLTLYAEMIYAHFGHAITDAPARLWPLATDALAEDRVDHVLGLGMLGAGHRGQHLPSYARSMLAAYGVPWDRMVFANKPMKVEKLLIPRRIAPYLGLMRVFYNQVMQRAGARLAATADPAAARPERLWLSRSRLRNDPRNGPALAPLDKVFADMGFTVVHPQELPLAEQIALVRGATHIAGPVGSQTHLCAFSDRPGLKVFSVGPEYFKLAINERILRAQGGSEDHFLVPLPRPKGSRDQAPWAFDPALTDDLRRAVAAWLDGAGG